MKIANKIIQLKTKKPLQFIDLTNEISHFVVKSKVNNGSALIFSKHTTVAIRVNEKEKGFFADFADLTKRLAPKDAYYRHNDLSIRTENLVCDPKASDCLNGHSHCLHLFLGTSETVPIIDGQLTLGTFQRIFAIELDCARKREIVVQVSGN